VLSNGQNDWLTHDGIYSDVAQSVETLLMRSKIRIRFLMTAGLVRLPSCPDRLWGPFSPLFAMKQWHFSVWLKRSELEAEHAFILWGLKHRDNSHNFTQFSNKTTYKPTDLCRVSYLSGDVYDWYSWNIRLVWGFSWFSSVSPRNCLGEALKSRFLPHSLHQAGLYIYDLWDFRIPARCSLRPSVCWDVTRGRLVVGYRYVGTAFVKMGPKRR
jgi:hypothetical protein